MVASSALPSPLFLLLRKNLRSSNYTGAYCYFEGDREPPTRVFRISTDSFGLVQVAYSTEEFELMFDSCPPRATSPASDPESL